MYNEQRLRLWERHRQSERICNQSNFLSIASQQNLEMTNVLGLGAPNFCVNTLTYCVNTLTWIKFEIQEIVHR